MNLKFNIDDINYIINIDDINYIKIVYKDEDNFPHCIKAGIRDINKHDIYASAKFDGDFFIKTPKNIELGIITETGLYKAKTELKYMTKEPPYVFFSIKTPEIVEFFQNREFFRVKINENAEMLYLKNGLEKVMSCETYDLSANGVRLIIDSLEEIPEIATITLHLPDKDITTEAKYIRTDDEDNILKVSYHYTNIKDSDLDYISKICLKRQLEQRKRIR